MTKLETQLYTVEQIVEAAPKLRAAGVRRLQTPELLIDLAALEPEASEPDADAADDDDDGMGSPLYDKATFGGRRVPGRQRGDRE